MVDSWLWIYDSKRYEMIFKISVSEIVRRKDVKLEIVCFFWELFQTCLARSKQSNDLRRVQGISAEQYHMSRGYRCLSHCLS